jgi:hypothetical protein
MFKEVSGIDEGNLAPNRWEKGEESYLELCPIRGNNEIKVMYI